jgi:hypothetical protein
LQNAKKDERRRRGLARRCSPFGDETLDLVLLHAKAGNLALQKFSVYL